MKTYETKVPVWHVSKEATSKVRVRHLAGHQRLGMGYSKCGKTIGDAVKTKRDSDILRPCESCQAKAIDEETVVTERDLMTRNYNLMRNAKIKAEEALLELKGKLLFLKEQNMALGQEREKILSRSNTDVAMLRHIGSSLLAAVSYWWRNRDR